MSITNTFENLDVAKIDTGRKDRTGFPEVVFCPQKEDEYLLKIYKKLYETQGHVFGTRANSHQAQIVKKDFPQAEYDEVSKVLQILPAKKTELIGNIAVCTAGTADIPVAEECVKTIEYFGSKAFRFYDVGVSGIHRLFSQMNEINKANVVVAIAGMEGALASVLGGLVKVPVIAVPTSVGYGAGFGGLSALLTMVNSCANGISVVNIDNGYGAGYISTQINRLAEKKDMFCS